METVNTINTKRQVEDGYVAMARVRTLKKGVSR